MGQRPKDIRNGLSIPPRVTLPTLANVLTKPQWCMRMLRTPQRQFGNIIGHAKDVTTMSSLAAWTAQQFEPSLSWVDVEWVKKRRGGKLIVKGIMYPQDARPAATVGAPSSIAALPAVVDAVRGEIEVHMDGGVRSGQDVLRACLPLALKVCTSLAPFYTDLVPWESLV